MSGFSEAVGIAVLIVSIGIVGLSLSLLRGRLRSSNLLEALAHVALVTERRRRFVQLRMFEAVFFVGSGVTVGLVVLGVALPVDSDALIGAVLLGGLISMGLLSWFTLGTRPLSAEERADLEKNAPSIMASLWIAPYRDSSSFAADERRP